MTSLYNDFQSTPNNLNQMNNLVNQFNQFKSMFTGNPKEQVQQLLQSGRMTQAQFNNFAQAANQLRKLIK